MTQKWILNSVVGAIAIPNSSFGCSFLVKEVLPMINSSQFGDFQMHMVLGIHPHCASQYSAEFLSFLELHAAHPVVVAIGEIGTC